MQEQGIPDLGKDFGRRSQHSHPEARASLMCSRNNRDASVADASTGARAVGDKVRRGYVGCYSILGKEMLDSVYILLMEFFTGVRSECPKSTQNFLGAFFVPHSHCLFTCL